MGSSTTPPTCFVVSEAFHYRKPEFVRDVAQTSGFTCHTDQGTSKSEIWSKAANEGGHWIIRIDSMGHDTTRHFGARPHYHKNWVESDDVLRRYLRTFTPAAWVYSDSGILAGLAGGGAGMHPDLRAKLQHIPR